MNTIQQIENLFSILMASFEGQLETIELLGYHSRRAELINYTKKLVETLLRSLDITQSQLVNDIEGAAEEILGQSACLMKTLKKTESELPEVEILHELAESSNAGHHLLSSFLAQGEEGLIDEISARFKKMKERAQSLLSRIDNMQT